MRKNILFCLFFTAALMQAAEIRIVERRKLDQGYFELLPGQKKEWRTPMLKVSSNPDPKIKTGLRIRVFAKHHGYGGWNRFMHIKVNGHIVERYDENRIPRLVNRPDIKKPLKGYYQRYYGEPWYNVYGKSWDICYGKALVEPPKRFDPGFAEDVTDYLFDIDDLVTVDAPIDIQLRNNGDQYPDIVKLIKFKKQQFPMAVASVEAVTFINPDGRLPASIKLPPPTEKQIAEFGKRFKVYPEFSEEGFREELKNLQYSEQTFADCGRHWQMRFSYPGHIWLQYSFRDKAEKFIPLLDRAKADGMEVVKVHAHWADINGKGPFTVPTEAGKRSVRRLTELCHERGMKLIVYVSPSWVKNNDDYRTEWEFSDRSGYSPKRPTWRRVCTGSPAWRSFFFKGVKSIFDTFPEIDGIYVDYGIREDMERACSNPDHINAFRHSSNPLAASEDMFNRLYAYCRKHGKLMYVFAETTPNTQDYCDVHYVGESTQTMPAHRERHESYRGVLFFLTMCSFSYYSHREIYGTTMSMGHFPMAYGYGPPYGWKDKTADPLWYRYFFQAWKPMSVPGTHIYRDIGKSPLLKKTGRDLCITAYVNTSIYLVVCNKSGRKSTICLTEPMENLETGKKETSFEIPPRDFKLLRLR
jgi:hypothetical protein